MSEGSAEHKPKMLSAREAANVLLRQAEDLINAPRSIAIEIPADLIELAESLRHIVELPVEFLLTYDKKFDCLVLTTGGETEGVHPSLEHKEADKEGLLVIVRRLDAGSVHSHNHRLFHGVPKPTPSPDDWAQIAKDYVYGGPAYGQIISAAGLTEYGFMDSVYDWKQVCPMFNVLLPELRKRVGLPDIRPTVFTQDHATKGAELDGLFASHIGGRYNVTPWNDTKGIVAALERFIRFSREGRAGFNKKARVL